VSLVDHDNKLQQFVKTQVANGQFVLEGELAMAGFYDIQIKGMEAFTLFVEGGSDYDLSENQGKFTLTTSSQNARISYSSMRTINSVKRRKKIKQQIKANG
jgi:hypothetical protein